MRYYLLPQGNKIATIRICKQVVVFVEHFPPGFVSTLHRHRNYECFIFLNGVGELQQREIRSPSLFVIPPNEIHGARIASEAVCLGCMFGTDVKDLDHFMEYITQHPSM